MAKSRAEIQRAYRKRKKEQEGEAYLEKERKRVQKYYVPIEERTTASKKTRRDKVRQYVQEHRYRKKNIEKIVSEQPSSSMEVSTETDENGVSSSTSGPLLKLKFPFDAKNRTRRRISRITSKSQREIKKLLKDNEALKKKVKRVSKRYERLLKKTKSPNTSVLIDNNSELGDTDDSIREPLENLTPRKRTARDLQEAGVSPRKIPRKLKDTMLMAHVLVDEIKNAREVNGQRGKHMIANVLSGKVIKKYRMKRKLGRSTGIYRQSQFENKKCDSFPQIRKRVEQRQKVTKEVHDFLLLDENSRIMPGKNDIVKEGAIIKQKRVLNDSMGFLHLKFKSETESKISFATFCRMRPANVCLTRYITRNQCLCQRHQNMALTLRSMKNAGARVSVNPDDFVRQGRDILHYINEIEADTIHHDQWRKVTQNDGKKRTKVVGKDIPKAEFQKLAQEQVCDFKVHIEIIKSQYQAMHNLKERLQEGQTIVQMDFAENFGCTSADEVQSAYWNTNTVTLHPVVSYYRDNGEMKHTNFVFVSDDLGHNIGSVYAILKKLIPEVKSAMNGNLQRVFYWTDSPSSQYRNKTAFYLISSHASLLGTEAEWNYWESGHGKGACDGIGGTAKRMADMNVRQGKVNIQDATDFYEWGKKYHVSAKYVFVSGEECSVARSELEEINKTLTPIKGTMKLHHVHSQRTGTVRIKNTSCYCENCVTGEHHDCEERQLIKERPSSETMQTPAETTTNIRDNNQNTPVEGNRPEDVPPKSFAENDWVAVMYDGNWHIGRVLEVDENDADYLVSFMRQANVHCKGSRSFKWPSSADEIWVKLDDIIIQISEPKAVGRSCRSFEISESDVHAILQRVKDL